MSYTEEQIRKAISQAIKNRNASLRYYEKHYPYIRYRKEPNEYILAIALKQILETGSLTES